MKQDTSQSSGVKFPGPTRLCSGPGEVFRGSGLPSIGDPNAPSPLNVCDNACCLSHIAAFGWLEARWCTWQSSAGLYTVAAQPHQRPRLEGSWP
jgi:hypothetical protein